MRLPSELSESVLVANTIAQANTTMTADRIAVARFEFTPVTPTFANIAVSEAKKEKDKKITALIPKFKAITVNYFAPTYFIRMDEKFVERLIALEIQGGDGGE